MRFLSLVMMLLSTACADTALAVLNVPTSFDDIKVIRDVSYGERGDQKLDIYTPTSHSEAPSDVIVFFYGGRWEMGDKEQYAFVGDTLARQGFVVVIPDYRKFPSVRFPAFVQDGAQAVAWTYDTIAHYGGNPQAINLSGHSAGAHIAALLATDAHYLADLGKDRSTVVRSFAGLAGPYDFTPDEDDLEDMFGPPENYPLMQVTSFIDGKQPPMLLLYGDQDTLVKPSNSEKLSAAIQQRGGSVRTIIYPGSGHIKIVTALSWLKSGDYPVARDMADFFHANDHQ